MTDHAGTILPAPGMVPDGRTNQPAAATGRGVRVPAHPSPPRGEGARRAGEGDAARPKALIPRGEGAPSALLPSTPLGAGGAGRRAGEGDAARRGACGLRRPDRPSPGLRPSSPRGGEGAGARLQARLRVKPRRFQSTALYVIGLSTALALLFAAIAPPSTRAQADKFPEGMVGSIEFEGNATITPDRIKPKLLSRVGQPLDQNKVEADLKSLMGTKWFSHVSYYLEESPPKSSKYTIYFVVREMPLLTKVEFLGRKAVRLKEIEDTTDLKVGKRADPTRTWLAVGQIQRLYQEKGYDLVSVKLLEGGNQGDTKIVIEIFEGPKVKVSRIDFVGNHFASGATLKTHISTRKPILGLFGRYKSDMLDEDRQKLIDYYQSQGFFEVQVTPVTRPGENPGNIDLTFVISEGTRFKVRNVIIEGNTKIKTETLRKDLELHSGKPFILAVREADKNRMLIKYGEIGCIDAEIDCEPRFTDQSGVVDLLYKIEEHEPYMLGELRIVGNARTKRQGDSPRSGDGGAIARRGPGQDAGRDLSAAADGPGLFPE